MEFKKFGNVVMILGLLICGYGGFLWFSNQAEEYQRPAATNSIMGGLNAMGDMLAMQDKNAERAENRKNAFNIIVAGGVVAFLGLGVSYSAKKRD